MPPLEEDWSKDIPLLQSFHPCRVERKKEMKVF
jgi:hypothetical protein